MILYPNAVLNSVLPVKSCVQRSLGQGGSRLEGLSRWSSEAWDARQTFALRCLSEGTKINLLPSRVTAVDSGGKWRVVSVGDVEMNILRPLHSAIYNHISRFEWLLRGEAVGSKFKSFTAREGEVFVSGDYESATDNLNMHVQKVIMEGILEGCRWVPDHVKQLALSSQQMNLVTSSGAVLVQQRGQLMGNLLSFPLLCLVNYLAFRYYTGGDRSIPVKINGDDIVFRASKRFANRWMRKVVGSGLTLSVGKTMVSPRYFTVNSCLFKATRGNVRRLPVLRSTALGFRKPEDGVASLYGRWRRVRRDFFYGGSRRLVLEKTFLKVNVPYIVASRRSVTRGLGMSFSYEALCQTSLWNRECWYLSFEKEDPLPLSPAQLDQARVPTDWQLRRVDDITKEIRDISRGVGAAFVECAWSPATLVRSDENYGWKEEVSQAPFYAPLKSMPIRRKARLLGLSVRNARRFLRPAILRNGRVVRAPSDILAMSRPTGKKVWLPAEFVSKNLSFSVSKDQLAAEASDSEPSGEE
jgi:hypothetical protein